MNQLIFNQIKSQFMTIKLYIDYMSQPSRAVLSLLLINKIPHEVIQTRLNQLQNRSPQFSKINPFKKVPAIHDTENDLFLAQSHAIMRYICGKYNLPENWYPGDKDLARTAKIDEYLDFHHLNTRLVANLVFNTLFAKKLGVSDPSFNEQKAKKNVEYALSCVESVYLSKGEYIVGDQLSIADLSAFFEIQMLFLRDYNFAKWTKINKWMQKISKIPQVQAINKTFFKVAVKIKQANL